MAVKKIEEENERPTFKIIGISSLSKDYRICFFLNEFLQADFVQTAPIQIIPKGKTESIAFRTFTWKSEYSDTEMFLFNNHSGTEVLLPDAKNIDYLIKIHGAFNPQPLVDHLKSINEISSCGLLPLQKLKSIKFLEHIY